VYGLLLLDARKYVICGQPFTGLVVSLIWYIVQSMTKIDQKRFDPIHLEQTIEYLHNRVRELENENKKLRFELQNIKDQLVHDLTELYTIESTAGIQADHLFVEVRLEPKALRHAVTKTMMLTAKFPAAIEDEIFNRLARFVREELWATKKQFEDCVGR
jgi:hypothetical protein